MSIGNLALIGGYFGWEAKWMSRTYDDGAYSADTSRDSTVNEGIEATGKRH